MAVLFPFDAIKIQFDSRYPCDNYDKLTDVIVNQRKSTKNKNGKHTVNLKRVKCDPSALNVDSFLIRIVRGTEHCQKKNENNNANADGKSRSMWVAGCTQRTATNSLPVGVLSLCKHAQNYMAEKPLQLDWIGWMVSNYGIGTVRATLPIHWKAVAITVTILVAIYIQTVFPIVVLPAKQNSP